MRSLALSRFAPAALALGAVTLLTGCGPDNLFQAARNPLGYGVCGLIILVLDVLALIEVLNSRRSTGDKVLWSLVIVFFPFVGLLAYYFIGRR